MGGGRQDGMGNREYSRRQRAGDKALHRERHDQARRQNPHPGRRHRRQIRYHSLIIPAAQIIGLSSPSPLWGGRGGGAIVTSQCGFPLRQIMLGWVVWRGPPDTAFSTLRERSRHASLV